MNPSLNLLFLTICLSLTACTIADDSRVVSTQHHPETQPSPEPEKPVITEITPSPAKRGEVITIHGHNLFGNEVFVAFTSSIATGVGLVPDGTRIFVTVPHDADAGIVFVCVDGRVSNTLKLDLELPVPIILEISPPQARPGDVIVLHGSNLFGNNVTVRFPNAITSEVGRFANGKALAVKIPHGAKSGYIDVIVDTMVSNPHPFTIVTTPPELVIHSIEPPVARRGDIITIHGEGMLGMKIKIDFNGVATNQAIVSPDGKKLNVKVPPEASSGNLIVTVDDRTSNALYLTIE